MMSEILKALDLFYKAERNNPPQFYLRPCKAILVRVKESLEKEGSKAAKGASEEVAMAITHIEYYESDPEMYHTSPAYFYGHMGRAIALLLGLR